VTWNGTLVSSATFGLRGTFEFRGPIEGSAIRGTLDVTMGASPKVSHPVTGAVSHEDDPSSSSYDVVELKETGGSLTFSSTTFDGYKNDSPMIGSYVNGGDSGSWHTVVGGLVEAPIEKAVPLPADMTVSDLCFAGDQLYAVATPSSGTAALYTVNRDNGEFLLVPGAPASPAGVGYDGTQYWIATGKSGQTVLSNYDGSWQAKGASWTVSVSSPAASQFAVHDNEAWLAPFLAGGVATVDLATGASADSGIAVERAGGIEFVGDQLWTSYFPSGGVWGSLVEHELSGDEHARFYTPENGGGSLAVEGDFLWVVSVKGIYKVRVR